MRAAAVLALVLACAAAGAQAPARPTAAKPFAPKPPVVAPVAPARLASLRTELAAVNTRIDALRDKPRSRDSIGGMNEEDMRALKELMDRKGQLESMISSIMKAGAGTSQPATQSLKDS